MFGAIPAPALVLGGGGLIPFMAGALGVLVLEPGAATFALEAQIFYGVTILTFLGAVHWGVVMTAAGTVDWRLGGWSVTPALVAWSATFLTAPYALIVLITGLIAAFFFDRQETLKGHLPKWYLGLRKILTTGAVVSLGVSLMRTLGVF